MEKVHEIDGVTIYETDEGSSFEGLVIQPAEIERLTNSTFKKIQEWCMKHHNAYAAKDLFIHCCFHFNEQFMKQEDLDLLIKFFPDTEIGNKALEEKIAWRERESRRYSPRTKLPPVVKEREKKRGSIYVMKAGNGLYKIGKSLNPTKRTFELSTKSPVEIALVGHVEVDDYHGIELELHAKFSDKRRIGEWFALEERDVAEILQGAAL